MGITIHYKGKLKSPGLINRVIDELEDIAKDMQWKYSTLSGDLHKPNTAKIEYSSNGAEITGNLPLKGIIINIHPQCESLAFHFDKDGVLRNTIAMTSDIDDANKYSTGNWIKTQFAPVDVHITIVKLLKYLKEKYFETFEVFDEGDYWETGDKNILQAKVKFLSERIDSVEKILSESEDELNDVNSVDELATKLEKILKDRLGKDGISLKSIKPPKKKK